MNLENRTRTGERNSAAPGRDRIHAGGAGRGARGEISHRPTTCENTYLINDRPTQPVPGSDVSSGNSGDHRFVDQV